ncbi:hypothetical protein [Pseudopedobacter saltans]|nr:hypothetical protein [Pseudopedobacter saltans]
MEKVGAISFFPERKAGAKAIKENVFVSFSKKKKNVSTKNVN